MLPKKLKKEGDTVTAMLHYPPFPFSLADSGFTKLFEKFGVTKVVYGHLHGANLRVEPVIEKHGVSYFLTSCDLVGNKLIELYR
jgi:Predicted phosphohydrolase